MDTHRTIYTDEKLGKLESSFEQIPFAAVTHRLDQGSQCLHEFSRIISANLENMQRNITFTSTISRTHIYESEIVASVTEKSLGFFKNYHLFVAKEQVLYYKELGEVVFKNIEDVKSNRLTVATKHRNAVQMAIRDVHLAMDALDKAKKNLGKAITELSVAREKLIHLDNEIEKAQEEKKSNFMGRMLTVFEATPSQDKDKYQKRIQKKIGIVITCKRDILLKKRLLKEKIHIRDVTIAQATEAAQALEYERLSCIKKSLKSFCDLEDKLIETRRQLLLSLSEVVNELNIENDLQLFVQQEKRTEMTHKYSKALDLLEWDYFKRGAEFFGSDADKLHLNNIDPALDNSLHLESISDEDIRLTSAFDFNAYESVTDLAIPGQKSRPSSTALATSPSISFLTGKSTSRITAKVKEDDGHEMSVLDVSEIRPEMIEKDDNDFIQASESNDEAGNTQLAEDNEETLPASSTAREDDLDKANKEGALENYGMTDSEIENRNIAVQTSLLRLFSDKDGNDAENVSSSDDIDQLLIEDNWKEILLIKHSRDTFLQVLDENRGIHAELSMKGFRAMEIAMKVILDHCLNMLDRKSALRVVNMANTFHNKKVKAPIDSDISPLPRENLMNDENGSQNENERIPQLSPLESPLDDRAYLLKEPKIRSHPIWHGKGFWEYCLMERISEQLQFTTPVQWDEISAEALREAVINVHNIVFGQLGTLAFTMHEIGLSFDEVQATILELSRGAQLVEDQEHELLKSIRKTFNININMIPSYSSNLSKEETSQENYDDPQTNTSVIEGSKQDVPDNQFLSIDPDDGNINDNGRATPTATLWADESMNEDAGNLENNPRLSLDPLGNLPIHYHTSETRPTSATFTSSTEHDSKTRELSNDTLKREVHVLDSVDSSRDVRRGSEDRRDEVPVSTVHDDDDDDEIRL